jgi:hypothetical protein
MKPETMGQARKWQSRMNIYLKLGLCHKCACQAAYGHQLGFAPHEHVSRTGNVALEGVHPPCDQCQPIVDTFPVEAWGKWRKHPDAFLSGYGRAVSGESNDYDS